MATFEIVEARPHMCGKMARMLRGEHQRAAIRVGMDVHRSLRDIYMQSWYRKAWLLDGQLAGLGGVKGSMLSPAGFVWVALSERATRYPGAIVREARAQLDYLMDFHAELHTTIIDGDEPAKRLAVFLGFHATDDGEGAAAYSRPGRRRLSEYLAQEADRIPFNGGYAIRLGYHS
jgi:hypothetical protein